jgi:ubiquinone/menaquinone biosynthesis C-methylase UbiE
MFGHMFLQFIFRAACAAVMSIALASGCDRTAPAPSPSNGSATAPLRLDDNNREQARYDQERRPDLIVAAAGIQPGQVLADVGAGSGLLTVHLARAVGATGKVVATDIDRAVLDLLSARLQAANIVNIVEPRIVTADTPGLEESTYDIVLLAEVDHYFSDPVAWFVTAQKALKPGGKMVVSNRIHHRTQALAAAKKAGLVLISETTPVPSHFVAIFQLPKGTP